MIRNLGKIDGPVTSDQGTSSPDGEGQPWYVRLPTYSQTAFGEVRVSTPKKLIDIINLYGLDTDKIVPSATLGGVTHDANNSGINIHASASDGAFVRLRTRAHALYRSARGHRFAISVFHENTGSAGQIRSWGLFDNNDGLHFQLSGSILGLVRKTSTSGVSVSNFTPSSNWNVDHMDGTGPSKINLNVMNGNIYEGDFEWLGAGDVNWFIDGHLVHKDPNPNTIQGAYMKTAHLPLSLDVQNINTNASGGMTFICADVSSENGDVEVTDIFACSSSLFTTSNALEVPLMSLRLAQTHRGVNNRGNFHPLVANVYVSNAANATFMVRRNSTLSYAAGTGSWNIVDPNSIVELNTNATGTSGGKIVKGPIFVDGIGAVEIDLTPIFDDHRELGPGLFRDPWTGSSDIITVSVKRFTGTNVDAQVGINFKEHK